MLYGIESIAGTLNFNLAGPTLTILPRTASPTSVWNSGAADGSSILSLTRVSAANAPLGTSSVMPVIYSSMVAPSSDIYLTSDLGM